MPKFGPRSLRELATCHPDLQLIAQTVIEWYDFSVIKGHRGKAEQTKAFETNKSKVQWPNSKHNSVPSMAMDVIPYNPDWGSTVWNKRAEFQHLAGHIQAVAQILYCEGKISHLVRWGGDWDKDNDLGDQSFYDLPHFELYKPGEPHE